LLDLTIVIPVKNDTIALDHCLQAIGLNFAKEIVVIDSGSLDDTKVIAYKHQTTFIDFIWDGQFPKKRNWFLLNHQPKTTWVLFLDADENLTDEFKTELRTALTSGSENVGYWLRYSIYFMGKPLKGGYPLHKLALFKVGAGLYEKIEEENWSNLDMEIHEHPILNGKLGLIKPKIEHCDYRSIYHYINKHNEYAKWEAYRLVNNLTSTNFMQNFTWKQKLKYKLVQTPLIGPVYFLGSYIFMGGFLDGFRGFIFAVLKMAYFFQVYINIKEIKQRGC
jgi:glycosyltransferase involved in cell wall biosynthesis